MLRALAREPGVQDALFAELQVARGLYGSYDRGLAVLQAQLAGSDRLELRARRLVERMALTLTASVLLRAQSPTAETFCRTRMDTHHGIALGTLPRDAPFAQLIERASPG